MEDTTRSNVLNMKAKSPIFGPELRARLITTLGGNGEAEKTVDNFEHIICSHIVLKLRTFGEKVGTILGEKFSNFLGLGNE